MSARFCCYKFISEPDDRLKCCVCREVATEPRQHEDCGRLLCKACVGRERVCPHCKISNCYYFKDRKSHREIQSLEVRCTNEERGCGWQGTIATLQDHITKCHFTMATYRLLHPTNTSLRKNHSAKSTREEYFGKFTSKSQTNEWWCPEKAKVSVSNPCLTTVKYADIIQHSESDDDDKDAYVNGWLATCEKDPSQEVSELRDAVTLCNKEIASLKDTIATLTSEVVALRKITQSIGYILRENEWMTITLPEFNHKKVNSKSFLSQMFYAYHPGGYKMRLHVFPGGDQSGLGSHVSVFVRLVRGPCDNKLHWPFVGTVTIKLLNQVADKDHLCRQVVFEKCHNKLPESDLGIAKFVAHSELSGCPGQPQYLQDDMLHFRVGINNTTNTSTLV